MQPLENDELLAEVIRALVDKPELVKVAEARRNGHSHLTIEVAPGDRGKVIGREGKTMRALRVLFGRIGAVEGRKIFLRVEGDTRVA